VQTFVGHATITADPGTSTMRIAREIDATVEDVFRAHVELALVRRWLLPREADTEVRAWDCVTGGSYRYGSGELELHGAFPEVVRNERIVHTYAAPLGVDPGGDLAVVTFAGVGGDRCWIETMTTHDSPAVRDRMLTHEVAPHVVNAYQRLEALVGR
jgi:uncharacterized protein YndB with AHSA1/START domain